jgi:hypothetical protein
MEAVDDGHFPRPQQSVMELTCNMQARLARGGARLAQGWAQTTKMQKGLQF